MTALRNEIATYSMSYTTAHTTAAHTPIAGCDDYHGAITCVEIEAITEAAKADLEGEEWEMVEGFDFSRLNDMVR